MDALLTRLKAAAEETRLRLLALCAHGELSVSELVQILGQSQPRVSRHLKLLCDAGLLDRFREGAFAFFRLAEAGRGAALARVLVDAIPADDPVLALDLERLDAIKRQRVEAAAAYFRDNADRWDEIRSLHAPEREVESALLEVLGDGPLGDLLDVGAGTGRMLELLGPLCARAVGVDQSREMLAIARAKLEQAGLRHCQVRHADMYQLPFPSASMDVALIHQVLHYAESPGEAVAEAARALRPGGRLAVVDFAPHLLEALREQHAHRRLGFADEEVAQWLRAAGLEPRQPLHLHGDPLTVVIWLADRPPPRLNQSTTSTPTGNAP